MNDDEEYRCATCQALCAPSEVCPACGNKGAVNAAMEPYRRASLHALSDEEIEVMLGALPSCYPRVPGRPFRPTGLFPAGPLRDLAVEYERRHIIKEHIA